MEWNWVIETLKENIGVISSFATFVIILWMKFVSNNAIMRDIKQYALNGILKSEQLEIKSVEGNNIVFNHLMETKNILMETLSEMKVLEEQNKQREVLKERELNMLVNVVVEFLSFVNVPIEKKEKAFKSLKSISIINDSILDFLEESIEQEKIEILRIKEKELEVENELEGV